MHYYVIIIQTFLAELKSRYLAHANKQMKSKTEQE